MSKIISQTPPLTEASRPSLIQQPNVELRPDDFNAAIETKGYRVVQEKTTKCPCTSSSTDHNPYPSCINCNGSGWVATQRVESKMLITSINLNTKYKEWTEELVGTVQITSRFETPLAFMDRIQIVDQTDTYSETLTLFRREDKIQSYPIYCPTEILLNLLKISKLQEKQQPCVIIYFTSIGCELLSNYYLCKRSNNIVVGDFCRCL